jgi:hypothetical protein
MNGQKIVISHAILHFAYGFIFSNHSLNADLTNHSKSTSLVENYDKYIYEIALAKYFGSCRFDRLDYHLAYVNRLKFEKCFY